MEVAPEEVILQHLKDFVSWINAAGTSPRTQARVISGIKAFSNIYCLKKSSKKTLPLY